MLSGSAPSTQRVMPALQTKWPNKNKVGKVTKKQVKEIAEQKLPDLNTTSLDSAMRSVAGTARSIGLEVVD